MAGVALIGISGDSAVSVTLNTSCSHSGYYILNENQILPRADDLAENIKDLPDFLSSILSRYLVSGNLFYMLTHRFIIVLSRIPSNRVNLHINLHTNLLTNLPTPPRPRFLKEIIISTEEHRRQGGQRGSKLQ